MIMVYISPFSYVLFHISQQCFAVSVYRFLLSLILSHLKIKLAYYSFIGASRRHETPASETKDFITHNTVSSINISMFVSASLASTSHESDVQLHI